MRLSVRSLATPTLILCLGLSSCTINVGGDAEARSGKNSSIQRESRTVEKSKVEMVRAEIDMGAGELKIKGGAEKLLEAEFAYNRPSWKPEVRYESTGFRGQLLIKQGKGSSTGDVVNKWDLKFANDVPLDLEVTCGAGDNNLDLKDLILRSVQVRLGAGRVELDLRGKPLKDFAAKIEGGVGQAIVRVPKEVGVIAEARGGLGDIHVEGFDKDGGSYVNESYRKSKITIHLDIKGGIGEIRLISE
jgi:hypothetical protein